MPLSVKGVSINFYRAKKNPISDEGGGFALMESLFLMSKNDAPCSNCYGT